eukprot:Phypoly_transcript_10760.p1 GENE.Phypoly_transcript_10760~~Phypoly_transcript_10760.p1  ORF type:complete len:339 (-),score=48.81 Phypoly_transcript_10760:10-1026(-)
MSRHLLAKFYDQPFSLDVVTKLLAAPKLRVSVVTKAMQAVKQHNQQSPQLCGLYLSHLARNGDRTTFSQGLEMVRDMKIEDETGWREAHMLLHAAHKEAPQAFSLLDSFFYEQKPHLLHANSFAFLLENLGESKESVDRLLHAWSAMRAGGMPANLTVTNTFLKKCLEAGEPESAVWFLQNLHQEGLKPDASTFEHLISASAAQNNWEGVNFWIKCMRRDGVKCDRKFYITLLGILARVGDEGEIRKWLERIKAEGEMTREIFFDAMEVAQGDPERSSFWIKEVKNWVPERKRVFLYQHLLQQAVDHDLPDMVKFWLDVMKKENVETELSKQLSSSDT